VSDEAKPVHEPVLSSTPEKPAKEAPPTLFGVPLASFVRGGTPTMAHERAVAEQEADAEKRRDIAAAERRIARVPIEQGGGKIYQTRMTENASVPQAYVLLDYLTARGEPIMYMGQPLQCLADIIISGAKIKSGGFGIHGQEMTLQIVCPQCVSRGMPMGQAQLTIRQSNKQWELDTSKAGLPLIFMGEAFPSAGRIVECERFSCPCGWSARIYDNKVRAE